MDYIAILFAQFKHFCYIATDSLELKFAKSVMKNLTVKHLQLKVFLMCFLITKEPILSLCWLHRVALTYWCMLNLGTCIVSC